MNASHRLKTRDELRGALEQAYVKAKPLNDQMLDIQSDIVEITSEIYRREIEALLPDTPLRTVRTALRLPCEVKPSNGLPQLRDGIEKIRQNKMTITEVVYDQNQGEFWFYVEAPNGPA